MSIAIALAGGAWIFSAFVVFFTFAAIYGLYTRSRQRDQPAALRQRVLEPGAGTRAQTKCGRQRPRLRAEP
jgi:hypothetical protein